MIACLSCCGMPETKLKQSKLVLRTQLDGLAHSPKQRSPGNTSA